MHISPGGRAGGLFPHSTIREGQERFLEDARMCLSQRTHLLAYAPTGLGKTAVSLTAAVETVLPSNGTVLFLTPRQSQHAIAVDTLRAIWRKQRIGAVDLIGRDDMCLARKDGRAPCAKGQACYFAPAPVDEAAGTLLEYPLHAQESMRSCLRAGVCPYHAALRAAGKATVIVADYNQMFSRSADLLDRLGRPGKDAVLVIDEAHNLPARTMENFSASLAARDLDLALSFPGLRHFTQDLELLRDRAAELMEGRSENISTEDIDGPLKSNCGVDSSGLAEEMEEALKGDPQHRTLLDFLHLWNRFGRDSVRFVEGDPPRLVTRLVDPGPAVSPVLAKVRSALLMSGTLHPPEMFADVLGAEGAVCRRYASPFPRENRMVLAVGGVSSRFRLRCQSMYEAVARQLVLCCAAVPGNLAAFFPSYDFMTMVEKALDRSAVGKEVVVERREFGKNERDAVVHRLSDGSNLLMATVNGSFSEGVDFKANLLSAVVVVGLPIPPPSREGESMLYCMEKKFGRRKADHYVHTYPAISKVLQAAGRAIRSETDRAAIVLMDDRYLLPSIRAAFPDDFVIERSRDLAEELSGFFRHDVPVAGPADAPSALDEEPRII